MMTDKRGNTSICQNDFLTLSDLNLNTGSYAGILKVKKYIEIMK